MEPPRDDDIEFDFFDDEPATTEGPSTQRARVQRALSRGGRGGPRRPPHGVTPMLRLLGLVAFVIFLVLVLVLLVQSCASSSKRDSYKNYMSKVSRVASDSASNGRAVADALTTPGVKVPDLVSKLRGIADQERQNVQAGEGLDPPGPLREEHQRMIEALQLRVSGVGGLATTFAKTAASKSTADAALLSAQADRLVASDVVWDDLFKDPAKTELEKQGISGVPVPDSNVVTNRELYSEKSMAAVLQRLRGAATGGTPTGLHGTNIVSVKVLPGGQVLSPNAENTVTATTDLAFSVTIEDSGDSQEVQIPITLTIEKPSQPIVKTRTVDLINPGEQKTVVFDNLGQVPFATKTNVKVDVKPVVGEKNKGNNSAVYPVIFSLGG